MCSPNTDAAEVTCKADPDAATASISSYPYFNFPPVLPCLSYRVLSLTKSTFSLSRCQGFRVSDLVMHMLMQIRGAAKEVSGCAQ